MTVGGGIGGVQASLDLAESGFKVYLVEEKAVYRWGNGSTRQDLPDK